MLIDARENHNLPFEHIDICIIGSGIGGSALAYDLSDANKNVLILEVGGIKSDSSLVPMVNKGRKFGLSSTRAFGVGGTSNLWHGVLAPLDKIDFEKRDWIPYSGWPIRYRDLIPYYRKASSIFGVVEEDYFYNNKIPQVLNTKLNEFHFDRDYLDNKLFQQPLPTTNFKRYILDDVAKSDSVHCLYHCRAMEIKFKEDQQTVEKVVCSVFSKQIEIAADIFVLAAGALESPCIILNSAYKNGDSLDKHNANIGRYLMDHPMGNLFQIEFPKLQRAHIYADMKYHSRCKIKSGIVFKDLIQKNLKLPNHNIYFRPSFKKGISNLSEKVKLSLLTFKDGHIRVKDCINLLKNINTLSQILAYRFALNPFYKYADAFFITEQTPNPNSRVYLSNEADEFGRKLPVVDWQVTDYDIESVYRCFDLFDKHNLLPDEIKYTHRKKDLQWESVFTSAAHHVGTLRMGSSKTYGVVDKNLKVFDTNNLYVCDGSVFPTSGNVNSGLTIAALSMRLGSHLRAIR